MAVPTVSGYVILTLRYTREGRRWVGTCQELSTSTFARTLKRCQEELGELVVEHLAVLDETGQRERFFRDWGIQFHTTQTPPQEVILRNDGDPAWNDLLKAVNDPGEGLLLQPRAFPIDQARGNQAALISA